MSELPKDLEGSIAVVGLAGRFPGALDAARFWENLRDGVESVRFLSDEEALALGVPPEVLTDPGFVRAVSQPDDVDRFDALFFGISHREAELLDPQQRVFLETAWEALEDAGYEPGRADGVIGVFAGATTSTYLIFNLLADPVLARSGDPLQLLIGNIGDTLATRVSYKLDLKGPSYTVQSACSSSLVAVHNACQSLLSGECDMALAGGVSINVSQSAGYRYQRESIASPDGHCRAFDAQAQGTIFGSGSGVVVLKRLEDAVRDGDTVRAVIRGSAVNNDGALKVGYTAPSVSGQAEVIAEALGAAGVEAETISYIEAHGTGTRLGDPIEIQALTRAYGAETERTGFCALGSVKTNIGHLDIAAGVAGLIKTVLALENRQIPPSLNFSEPNPEIDWTASPVYINTALTPWERDGTPRRAGVSSFGIGGTNAHVIVEEAPAAGASPAGRPWQLLVLSARSEAALEAATARLAAHLEKHPEIDAADLADVAWTLQAGRRTFPHRRIVVCHGREDALAALSGADPARLATGADSEEPRSRPVAFLFSGQGSQYPGMGRGLYETEPVFRREIDRCVGLLRPRIGNLGLDLREVLFPPLETTGAVEDEQAAARLARTELAQPALFTFEYALARQWMEWGVAPAAMLGHSLGEYVAACLAGVLTLEDALRLVAVRGRLMQELPAGAMTAVALAEEEVAPLLGSELSVAAVNEPGRCVISGTIEAVEVLERRLAEEGKGFRRLHTSHAFHSSMMEPILGRFREEVVKVRLSPPRLPWISNLTGTWITPEEATDPEYWVRHLRQPVRFADGIATLLAEDRILLEVGPGNALTTLARRQAAAIGRGRDVIASARHPKEKGEDPAVLLMALGRLFLAGLEVDWKRLYPGEHRRRVPLPTYPFERQRYWIGGRGAVAAGAAVVSEAGADAVAPPAQTLHQRPQLSAAYEPPRNTEEEVLAGLWQELLGVAPVGVHDDFFELGGHSLLGTQVISRVRDAFGVDLPLDVLFDAPTVARLAAAAVAAGGTIRAARVLSAISRLPRGERPLPLSFGQQRLWFIDQLEPGNPIYNEPRGLRIAGPLAVPALAASLAEVVRRHEALRTTFAAPQGDPVQVVAPACDVPLPVIDLSGLPDVAREAELRRVAGEEARRSFDLARGPLLRLLLLRLAPEEHAAVFNAHHIATDGWSMGVLVREMGTLYDALLAGRPSPLPELPIQYADFAAWQREHLAGEVLAEQLAWWRRELASAPHLLPLLTDRPRPPVRSPRGGVVPLALPADLATAVERLTLASIGGGGGSATPFMVLMAAFQALLHRSTGAQDLLVGFPVAGRPRPETEPLIGFFVNTLPLRSRPTPDTSWGELLGQVRTATLGALAHQELPFERLLDELGGERSLAHTPLVQVALALQNTPLPELSLAGLTLVPWEIHAGTAKFDLSLSLTRTSEGLTGAIEYAADLFDAVTIHRLGGHFQTLLQGAVAAPGTLLSDLPMMTATERHQVQVEWNDTREEETVLCLHEIFEAWAEATPEATAVVFGEESLTYGELHRRAEQLARHLRALGVAPESRVGIFVEPGIDPLVASLAVLQAGGAYVPLDISYPEERLVFMLEDAEVRVLLTRERLVPSLPSHRTEIVLLDGDFPDGPDSLPARRPDPDDVAYITFTSGSTGRPNGVLTRHRSAAHFAYQSAADFAIGPGDRVLQAASWSFDGWVQETWGAFAAGATLCVSRREAEIGGEALEEAMRRMGVTAAFLTPGRLATLTPEEIPGVVSLASGGEALPQELAARWAIPGRRFFNCYGPTETTVYTSVHHFSGSVDQEPSIGRPYGGAQIYLLDRGGQLVPPGSPGEIHIAGEGLARGYLDRPALTAERFVPHFAPVTPGERLYRTGDLARHRPDGTLEFLGRIDHQVKLRGLRIELGEIETVLGRHAGVREARVFVRADGAGGEKRLVAYLLPAGDEAPAAAELRAHLREHLPEHMVPAAFMALPAWPLTPNGKIDAKALPAPEGRPEAPTEVVEPHSETERAIARVWQEVLGLEHVGARDNFFDLGGHSLLMPRLHARLRDALGERGRGLTLVDLFRFPTVAALAGFLHPAGSEPEPLERSRDRALARQGALERRDRRIAVVGMAGRFPGAPGVEQLWENLAAGVESIRQLSPEELADADPVLAGDPRHVPAVSMPDGFDRFDALFFGLNHREAELLDPQQRLFLEVAWEALEDAGHEPATAGRSVGVFAGTALSTYLLYHLAQDEEVRRSADPVQLLIANGADSLATRVSYKLGLEGPSYTVQSACSTSLVAVHHACQSLLAGECDVALAGGSSLPLGNRLGYLYTEGSIASPDGHCRAFDAEARGTVFGGGAGAVVLKRLADALRDGDTVRAVLLGSAVNNDGSDKIGYTAPSVTGQAEVIAEALAVAGVEPATISYIEAHGTGTPVGDPIEIAALTQVIGADSRSAPCAIGSVKTNFGHLDSAAGVAGLIKTVLALEHGQIPPSLHFERPNPEIDFAGSLYVNTSLSPWTANGTPRRAGVSSFGIGGTNAHVVLEEAPRVPAAPSARKLHLLTLSARSEEALDAAAARLAAYLERHPELEIADVAWTLATGRRAFPMRRTAVVRHREDAVRVLTAPAEVSEVREAGPGERSVAFLLSGQGSQYPGMGRGLYEREPVFRRKIDRAAEILHPLLGLDLRDVLFSEEAGEAAAERLRQTALAQPALFAFEYALTRQWMEWGVAPAALLGHSLGEYVAACLAGVFSLDDALRLVALRGKLMQEMPPGAMLAVALSEEAITPLLGVDLSIAAVNEPGRSVVSGPFEAIGELERRLAADGFGSRRLHTSHAFHSAMMEPAVERFAAEVRKVRLDPPRLPFVSNVTGAWITAEEATDPSYWARHLRAPVRFADGVAELLREEGRILLEVGPGNALATLARRQADASRVVASTRHARQQADDAEVLLDALGRLWRAGLRLDPARLYPGEHRRRVPLPTYPFERQRYWIEGRGIEGRRSSEQPRSGGSWLLRADERGIAADITAQLLEDDPLAAARRLQALSEELALAASRLASSPPPPAPATRARHARPRLPTPFVASRDAAEQQIAAIWQELLGIDQIGVDDDFFALGGHSLLGTQVLSRVSRTFGVDLPIDVLFDAPTVAGFARQIAPEQPAQPSADHIVPTGAGEGPLSFSQERVWLFERLQPGSSVYNLPVVVRLTGDLDVEALRRSFAEVVRRHSALRVIFREADGEPRQVVTPAGPLPLPVVDLSALPAPHCDQETGQRLLEEVDRPFDIECGPLFRLLLLRLGNREHVLSATMHHIVSDGWSTRVLVGETGALYEAFVQGRPSPLPELPIQYVDFALWQRQRLAGPELAGHLDFWRRELAGAPTVLELPTDRPRPAVESHRGAHQPFTWSAATTAAIQALARQSGATPFMALLTAFHTLLHRYSGADDVLVGSVHANRNQVDLEKLIGFFINAQVFRLRFVEGEGFADLLERVRATTLAVHAHRDLPFELLLGELGVERSLAHHPLFQVMLVLQNAPLGELRLPGLTFSPVDLPRTAANFDLTLYLFETGDGLAGLIEYASDLFDAPTVARFLSHFQALLEAVAADPALPVDRIPLMNEAERHQVLRAWNDTEQPALVETTDARVQELFEEQAGLRPDHPAVIRGAERLTYRELDRRANRLARHLQSLGVGPGNFVGLLVERRPEMLVGILGILKAGGAYVPLDPASPPERIDFMLRDSAARVLVTGEPFSSMVTPPGGLAVCLDRDRALLDNLSGEPVPNRSAAGDPAYVIYTSGTTGQPKGVVVSHRSLAGYTRAAAEEIGLGPEDRVLQFASISFDTSAEEIFPCLASGATLVLRTDAMLDSAAGFLAACGSWGITFLDLPTAYWHQVTSEIARVRLEIPRSLRHVIIGGEAARADRWAEWAEAVGDAVELVNTYGPTETTIVASQSRLTRLAGTGLAGGRVPIGRPVPNARLYVLDRFLQPVPIGVVGELYIAGQGVSLGYLGRPGLTAEKFLPDPFAEAPGARCYRTADLARFRADGELEYIGRADRQVKIRGFRVELGEIEAALGQHPGVRDVAVVIREDRPGDMRLAAYVASRAHEEAEPEETELSPSALRTFLAQRLPEYMIPADWVFLEALPLTPNGKVDRKALPAPERHDDGIVREAPRTATEIRLAEIWTEILGLETLGREESFFELGGHSLLATRIFSRVREAFRTDLPLRVLFEVPTIAGLAERIDAAATAALFEAPPLRSTGASEAPLSFAQERLWFLDRLQPDSPLYNLPSILRLTGDLDVAALRRSFVEVVRRQGALRTIFAEAGGEPRQVVAPPGPVPLPVIDLSALPADRREGESSRQIALEVNHPFRLDRGPLLRLHLLRYGERDHTLIVNVHHIVSDGWSAGVLVREGTALYDAFVQGRPSPLPEPPIQYIDFALWQRRWLAGPVLEAQLDFWRRELAGAPALLEIPTDRPRPAVQSFRGATLTSPLPAEATAAVQALARQANATAFMVFLAAFQTLLHRWSGADDVLVGSPIANRNRVETEELIGFFVNTLVFRLRPRPEDDFLAVLRRVRETTIASHDHQDLPFELLVDALGVERSLSHNPLFQVLLVLQNAPIGELRLPGLTFAQVQRPGSTAKFDLGLELIETAESLTSSVEYATDLFDGTTVRRLLSQLAVLLEGTAADPGRRLSDLPLLSEAEIHQVGREWNDMPGGGEPFASVPALLATQAARTPEAVAVAGAGLELTFGELDRRAERLARRLRALGVGPEVRVGLLAERSPELAVGLLGILRAGGAFIPLDPFHPEERLAFVLEDALHDQDVRVAVATPGISPDLPGLTVVSTLAGEEAPGAELLPLPEVAPESLAYVLYTSGTTGRPKGVLVEHGHLAHTLAAARSFGFAADERVFALAPSTFDIFLFELLPPLLAGGAVVLVPLRPALEIADLVAGLRSGTRVHAVPALMRQIVDRIRQESPEEIAALREVYVGGDAVPPDLLDDLRAVFPSARVRVLYGPTEGTILCASFPASRATSVQLIGRPLPGSALSVRDPLGSPLPAGVPGEVWLRGPAVTRGYLGRPDLTAERFVPAAGGDRWYRTGDRARYLPDGALEFLGRTDRQVKIRGVRVEPGEIEAVLARQPDVQEAAVLAREDVPGERRLVAYFVPAPEAGSPDLDDLRARLARELPDVMIPAAFVPLPALPLTPHGKVDRKALPAPEMGPRDKEGLVAPRTPAEEVLAGIWSALLGIERVGAHDDFFALGGHSLMATRVVSRIKDVFGVEIPLRALFAGPTVAALAEQIGAVRAGAFEEPPLLPTGAVEAPLSFAQERLWFLDRLQPGGSLYNIPAVLRLSGELDVEALRRSFTEIVRRHGSLRTIFVDADGAPRQALTSPGEAALPVVDLSGLPELQRQEEAGQRLAEEVDHPFDLARGPLLRLHLFRLGHRDHLLIANVHHIVSDGWSAGVLVRETTILYEAFLQGLPSPLPELPVQYTDFTLWQRRRLSGPRLEAQLDFWRRELAGAPALLEFPADRPRPAVQSYRGASLTFLLPDEATAAVHGLARHEGATPFMVLLAAFQTLLHRHSGAADVLVGSPFANRSRVEIEGLIGFFVNTLVFHLRVPEGGSFLSVLSGVRATTLASHEHQDFPFELLVDALKVERSLAHNPLFQVMLALQNAPAGELRVPGLTLSPVVQPSTTAKFDLTISLVETHEGLAGTIEYATDLFDRTTVLRLLSHFANLLAGVATEPARRLSEIPLLSAAERHQLLAAWNDTAERFDGVETCLHDLIAAQAARTPDAVAVVF
ncbi:MAG TPA: amino acid adenylation domain-containing protein, partial [Thermoanaerobaculia bacterium]